MKTEIRKLICCWLMTLLFWIMPTCTFKTKFAIFLRQNIKDF